MLAPVQKPTMLEAYKGVAGAGRPPSLLAQGEVLLAAQGREDVLRRSFNSHVT
jgi:hypothetical protein